MGGTDPGSAREEAERLVATLLATARLASAGRPAARPGPARWDPLGCPRSQCRPGRPAVRPSGGGFATGSAECCVCPVCRGIAALRDPSPEFAERLATGAGDLAAGVASLLRAFAPPEPAAATGRAARADRPATHREQRPTRPAASSDRPVRRGRDDHVWREATRTGHDSRRRRSRTSGPPPPGRRTRPCRPPHPPVDAAGPVAPHRHRPAADRRVVPASRAPRRRRRGRTRRRGLTTGHPGTARPRSADGAGSTAEGSGSGDADHRSRRRWHEGGRRCRGRHRHGPRAGPTGHPRR